MNLKNIIYLINEITLSSLNYEDGDIFLLSDIIDNIDKIKSELNNFEEINNIIVIIRNSLNLMFNGEKVDNFQDIFSVGIDLISRYVKSISYIKKKDKKIDELLTEDIKKFENDNNFFTNKSADVIKKNKTLNNIKEDKNSKENNQSKKNKKYTNEILSGAGVNTEVLDVFLIDAQDRLSHAQDIILKLEDDFNNKELINELFRIFHTIKGECGFLRLASLGELAHNLENLIDLLRNNEIKNNSEIIDILLKGIDYSFQILNAIKDGNITVFNEIEVNGFIDKINSHISKVKTSIGNILQSEGKLSESEIQKILQKQKESSFTKKFGEIAIENNLISEEEILETLEKQKKQEDGKIHMAEKSDPFIKVKASQINYLVDMVGELMITENQLEDKNINRLKKITREIHNAAMQLRTVKVKNLFINIKRIIRDLSKKLNKEIYCELQGEELEIDRNIVEALEEPLIHLVRNSLGHGIEDEDERKKKKKNTKGLIKITAERRGNNIVISITDDGRGLDRDKILEKALSKKLIDNDKAKTLNLNEIYNFIFLPGFSTAQNVDIVSGRGVGMDIVKNTVTNLRGYIDINSEKDKFTSINLVFPLSMAIIEGLIVDISGINFIIPVSNVIESLKLDKNMVHSVKHKSRVINLREEIIPIVELNDYFSLETGNQMERLIAVIIENNKKKYALIIDEIIAKKEIVIKSLGSKFAKLQGISSGTVLSGGKIGYVLNIEHILEGYN